MFDIVDSRINEHELQCCLNNVLAKVSILKVYSHLCNSGGSAALIAPLLSRQTHGFLQGQFLGPCYGISACCNGFPTNFLAIKAALSQTANGIITLCASHYIYFKCGTSVLTTIHKDITHRVKEVVC